MPYVLQTDSGLFELNPTYIPQQNSSGGDARVRLVRAFGSKDWFRVRDSAPEPQAFIMTGLVWSDRDGYAVAEELTALTEAVRNAVRLWDGAAFLPLEAGAEPQVVPLEPTLLEVTLVLWATTDTWLSPSVPGDVTSTLIEVPFGGGAFTDPTSTRPPATPTGLTATAGDAQVVLTWNANSETNLSHYNLYRGTTSGSLTKIAEVAAGTLTYTDTLLTNGTTYYYAISAQNTGGQESARTAEVSATPAAAVATYRYYQLLFTAPILTPTIFGIFRIFRCWTG